VPRARAAGLAVRGYVSTAFWCPYEGRIQPAAVAAIARQLLDVGVDEISIGDTIGRAVPAEVHALLDVLLDAVPRERVAMHFHDTRGAAVANAIASWERGITAFDASAGGVGGCPYAPGASGNVATEDLVEALRRAGAEVSADLSALRTASELLSAALGRPPRPRAGGTPSRPAGPPSPPGGSAPAP
jgi:hydroxymethylglutaryl-CoA lyase